MGFVLVNLCLAFTGAPGVNTTIGTMFLMTCLYLLADVCTDTMAVERSRFENEIIKHQLRVEEEVRNINEEIKQLTLKVDKTIEELNELIGCLST